MPRPDDVEFALQTMRIFFSQYTPKDYWNNTVIRPIVRYITSLEQELNKRGTQASLALKDKLGEVDSDGSVKDKDKTKNSSRVFDSTKYDRV